MPLTHWRTSRLLGCFCLCASVGLLGACHQKEPDGASAQAKEPAASITKPVSAPTPPAPAPVRSKPDFGGVTTEHVEVTATGPTIEAAVNNAIRLAVEQVNGKVVTGGALAVDTGAAITANGNRLDVQSKEFAQWLATSTSGAVTDFRILSQQQIEKPLSSDEESLKASKGESWDKGKFDASESTDVAANGSYNASASAHADDVGSADASSRSDEKLSGSHEAQASGQWDHHDGAQSVDYKKKHTEYAHEWQLKVAANVAKYRQAASASLTRVVVALPRTSQSTFHVGDADIPTEAVENRVRRELTDALTQTHRFTVLDRDADEEIGKEIDRIRSGNANPADTARLGQQLATDLIVIPTIDRFEYLRHERALRLSGRTLVSYTGGGALSFRVVNASTGQVVMSQSFQYQLPATAPTTLGTSVDGETLASLMMDALNKRIASAILRSTFPLSIVQRQGQSVVINQGGEAVVEGATYQAVVMGKELTDPQSGQSLGPTETPCCTVHVDRVTPTLSYGHIVEKGVALADPYVPGSVELREEVEPVAGPAPAAVHVAKRKTTVKSKTSAGPSSPSSGDSNW